MQDKYEVIWADTAEEDLLMIIEYIARDSPVEALKVLDKIKENVLALTVFPERCRVVPELYDHGINLYREMVIPPWRILYRISELQVFVLSVLDSRQNIEDILLKRLTQHII